MKILTTEQKTSFDNNGYLELRGFYDAAAMERMRAEFHDLIARTDGRPAAMRYSYLDPVDGYEIDPYNPKNVRGIMDQTLANDYWFNNFIDPRMIDVYIDLFGPDVDFHNGKVRNNPPGFTNDQGWHQDWPYERHTVPELAASVIYLNETDADVGATSIIPGSHKRGEWPTRNDGHTLAPETVPEDDAQIFKSAPGDVLIIHVQVIHSAGHNFTNTSRHKIINEYKSHRAIDCWGNKCAFAGLPLARDGKTVAHPV